jgi:hypothetical protein
VGGLADPAGFRSVHSHRIAASKALDKMLWMPRMVLLVMGYAGEVFTFGAELGKRGLAGGLPTG